MLFLREAGSPADPAIVLLHGSGLSSKMWLPQIASLQQDFYLLAPDLPQQGESWQVAPFSFEDSASQVAEIISAKVPGGMAHVVGLSLGGAVALTLLRLAPEHIDHMIVSGTEARLGRVPGHFSLAALGWTRFRNQDQRVESKLKQQGIPEQYRELVYFDLLRSTTKAFNRSVLQSLMDMQLPQRASRPLLALVGENENSRAWQAARKLVETLPGTRGAVVAAVGHVWNLQKPELFNQVLRAWVSNQPLPDDLKPIA